MSRLCPLARALSHQRLGTWGSPLLPSSDRERGSVLEHSILMPTQEPLILLGVIRRGGSWCSWGLMAGQPQLLNCLWMEASETQSSP